MKTINFLTAMTAIGIAVTLYSCEGKQGATGPQGATGATGAQGNANVVGQTFTNSMVTWNSLNSPYDYDQAFLAPISELTSTFVSSGGSVEVFLSTNGTTWEALPFTYYNSGGSNYVWEYKAESGQVELDWTYLGSSNGVFPNDNSIYGSTLEFEVVCIAPATINLHPNTNWKDYGQVEAIIKSQNTNNN